MNKPASLVAFRPESNAQEQHPRLLTSCLNLPWTLSYLACVCNFSNQSHNLHMFSDLSTVQSLQTQTFLKLRLRWARVCKMYPVTTNKKDFHTSFRLQRDGEDIRGSIQGSSSHDTTSRISPGYLVTLPADRLEQRVFPAVQDFCNLRRAPNQLEMKLTKCIPCHTFLHDESDCQLDMHWTVRVRQEQLDVTDSFMTMTQFVSLTCMYWIFMKFLGRSETVGCHRFLGDDSSICGFWHVLPLRFHTRSKAVGCHRVFHDNDSACELDIYWTYLVVQEPQVVSIRIFMKFLGRSVGCHRFLGDDSSICGFDMYCHYASIVVQKHMDVTESFMTMSPLASLTFIELT